jgi:hypothetical protein
MADIYLLKYIHTHTKKKKKSFKKYLEFTNARISPTMLYRTRWVT